VGAAGGAAWERAADPRDETVRGALPLFKLRNSADRAAWRQLVSSCHNITFPPTEVFPTGPSIATSQEQHKLTFTIFLYLYVIVFCTCHVSESFTYIGLNYIVSLTAVLKIGTYSAAEIFCIDTETLDFDEFLNCCQVWALLSEWELESPCTLRMEFRE
jgi:hypothetical protein